MQRHSNMFYNLGIVLLIATTSNGQVNFNDPILDPDNIQPNPNPLNNILLPADEANEVINVDQPLINEQPPQVDESLPEPNVEPSNVNGKPAPDNLAPETSEVPSQDEEGSNNDNIEPPLNNDLSPETNYVPPTENEVPSSVNEVSTQDNLPESSTAANEKPPSESEKDEVPNNDEDNNEDPINDGKPNPGDDLTPVIIELTPNASEEPPKIPPQIDITSDNNGQGDGNGGHGNHHRLRCNKRFGYMKIDGFCDKYVECKNYRPRRKVCPDGMYFNENALWSEYPCGYPSDVPPCRSRNPLSAQPTPYCPHQYGFFSYVSPDIQEQCSQYVMCSAGVPNVMHCPISLVFNPKVGRCDWPEQVPECKDINVNGFKCPDEYEEDNVEDNLDVAEVRNYKHEQKCSYFWSCLRGSARMLRCDYGMIFNHNYGRCVVDEYGSCNEYYYPDPPREGNPDDEERYSY